MLRKTLGAFAMRMGLLWMGLIAADVCRDPVRWDGLYSLVPTGPAAADLHAVCWELVGRLAR